MDLPQHHDALWTPTAAEARDSIGSGRVRRALIVNSPSLDVDADEVRLTPASNDVEGDVPTGCYAFAADDRAWDLLIVTDVAGAARSVSLASAPDSDSAVAGFRWFERCWKEATPYVPSDVLAPGSRVHIAGTEDIGVVMTGPSVAAGELIYKVSWGSDVAELAGRQLSMVEEDLGPESWVNSEPRDARSFARALTVRKLTSRFTDTVYSFRSSRTIYRSYQFRPLLRLLSSAKHRLLVADEVGLGKTIEAGLIWSELEHRTQLDRVLVVCPSGLRSKWVAEMRNRFDRRLVPLTTRVEIDDMVEEFELGGPSQLSAVASVESLRDETVVRRLAEAVPQFDLVIVDEAHVMRNPGTATHGLGQVLADAADALIFLSATPLNLKTDDLFSLLHLLDEDLFPDPHIFERQLEPNAALLDVARALRPGNTDLDAAADALDLLEREPAVANRPELQELRDLLDHGEIDGRARAECRRLVAEMNVLSGTVSRTRRADVATDFKARRSPREIHVEQTPAEVELHRTVAAWVRKRAYIRTGAPGLAASMPLRQAASCLPVMRDAIADDGSVRSWGAEDLDLPDVALDEEEELGRMGAELVAALDRLGGTDSKFEALVGELRTLQSIGYQQVMVFSYFRGTLDYLSRRLSGEFSVRVMDGRMKPRDRDVLMQQFRAGAFDVLLVSEVGSEGLDFEFCGALVNYDLPWNPMRVEQRIGRIDRFGQTRDIIHISNFVVPDTVETEIVYRLYARIRLFERSIGELEPILRDELAAIEDVVLRADLTEVERAEEVERIATAVAAKEIDIDDLAGARSSLTGIDNLLIEDFEQSTLPRGAYIGRAEIEDLAADFVRSYGGTWRIHDDVAAIRGTAELAEQVEAVLADRPSLRRHRSARQLSAQLRSELPLHLVLEGDSSAHSELELLGPGHPIVAAAAAAKTKEARGVTFACMAIDSDRYTGEYLVVFTVMEATGYRPTSQLVPIALNLETLERADDIGDEVMRAIAEGELRPSPPSRPQQLREALRLLLQARSELRSERQRDAEVRNDQLVGDQIRAMESSYALKTRRAAELLDRMRREGKSEKICALYEGRIRTLAARETERRRELEGRRGVAVRINPVAVGIVTAHRSSSGAPRGSGSAQAAAG